MSNEETKKKIINRLRTIKGHIEGIENMIEDDKPCKDVITQILAIKSSVNKVGHIIIENKASDCLNSKEMGEDELKDLLKLIFNYNK